MRDTEQNIFLAVTDAIRSGESSLFWRFRGMNNSKWVLCSDKDGNNLLHYIFRHHQSLLQTQQWLSLCGPEEMKSLMKMRNLKGELPQHCGPARALTYSQGKKGASPYEKKAPRRRNGF